MTPVPRPGRKPSALGETSASQLRVHTVVEIVKRLGGPEGRPVPFSRVYPELEPPPGSRKPELWRRTSAWRALDRARKEGLLTRSANGYRVSESFLYPFLRSRADLSATIDRGVGMLKEQPPADKFARDHLGSEAARLMPSLARGLGIWARAMDDAIAARMRQEGIEADPQFHAAAEGGKTPAVGPGKSITARAGWLAKEVLDGYLIPEQDSAFRRIGLPFAVYSRYRDPAPPAEWTDPYLPHQAPRREDYVPLTPEQRKLHNAMRKLVFQLMSSARRKALQAAFDQVEFEERTGRYY